MTVEEAKALVLCEGLASETIPKDAAFILLHFGDELSPDRMRNLLEALKIVCDGLQGETIMGRSLASALWTLGNSSNEWLFAHEKYQRQWSGGAMDDVLELIFTIEGVFYCIPFEGLKIASKE
jgi:hypothetical protein